MRKETKDEKKKSFYLDYDDHRHVTPIRQKQLVDVLDKYSDRFSERLGLVVGLVFQNRYVRVNYQLA